MKRIKVVARYQQYRAVRKITERLKSGKTPDERSGVVWHTQGSGKSLTMVFALRKLRTDERLKDFKVFLVNDRIDLERQLTKTVMLTGEKPVVIDSTKSLREKGATTSSNINMVMLHKFSERQGGDEPEYLSDALHGGELVPEYENFGVVNDSERVILMVDEAHRSQGGDIGDNLFEAFPNATRIAFTGTPLITERHEKKGRRTVDRFGTYIDKYRMRESVADGATVQIIYMGKTSEDFLDDPDGFDAKLEHAARRKAEKLVEDEHGNAALFPDLVRELTDKQLRAIKKRYGTAGDILEAEARIEEIAPDMVAHYVDEILPNGFKAQVVASSKLAAVRYQKALRKAIEARLALEEGKDPKDAELLWKLRMLRTAVWVSSGDTNELAEVVAARREAMQVNAKDNFTKSFDPEKPETGIGIIIVCARLLTGFDAPIEQVMYLDKKIREHDLLQAVARVNRRARGKARGFVVDYVGLTNHLAKALAIYAGEDYDGVKDTLRDISKEIPILEERYRRLVQLFEEGGVTEMEAFVNQRLGDTAEDFRVLEKAIDFLEDIKHRAHFEVYLKAFLQSMDIVLPRPAANQYKIPAKRFAYLLAKARYRFRDESMDVRWAGAKVRKLVNEHLESLGIDLKVPPVPLISDDFIKEIDQEHGHKGKASEMEHAIRRYINVHMEEDPDFFDAMSDKLEAVLERLKEQWEQLVLELEDLRKELVTPGAAIEPGLTPQESPFYRRLGSLAYGDDVVMSESDADTLKKLAAAIFAECKVHQSISNFWQKPAEIQRLRSRITHLLIGSGLRPVRDKRQEVATEIIALAKARHGDVVG